MSRFIQSVADWLWGPPMLLMVLGVGLYLFVRLRALPVRQFFAALREIVRRRQREEEGDISPFAALMTAVGGIVGNGNIAGVATAITAGGPGALFWMWISGLVGMGTMFTESVLGVRYRRRGADGLFLGGPMYYLRDRLGWRRVAGFFAAGLAFKATFATTTVQSNSMASVAQSELGWPPLVTCVAVALVTALVVIGGIRSIGRVSEWLAPFMGIAYVCGAVVVLFAFRRQLPEVMALVFHHAFHPMAAAGGFLGAGVREAFRFGIARGVYSNEAGTGSVPIAHASARTGDPVRQGRVAMMGVFLDTLVVCTATGLVLLATGSWTSGLDSTALAAAAFGQGLGVLGAPVVLGSSLLFGLTTLITWSFYGEQCVVYLLGARARIPYRTLYCVAILGGSLAGARAIWAWGDLLNALMAIPNLVAITVLGGEVARAVIAERRGAAETPVVP